MPATYRQLLLQNKLTNNVWSPRTDNPHNVTLTQAGTSEGAPLAIGFGGTGLTSFTADEFLTTDGLGLIQTSSGKAIPTGVVVGTTDTQTLTSKTMTTPVLNGPQTTDMISTDGLIDSSVATAATAFVLDATGGGHSGDLLELQDGGTAHLTFTDDYNLVFRNDGLQQGGIYQGGAVPSDYSGAGIKPKNAFYQSYTGALTASCQYSLVYAEALPKLNNTLSNTDIFGVNCYVKYLNNNTSQLRTVAGGRFLAQEATYGGGTTIGTMTGGEFIADITQATAATITHMHGGTFECNLASGQNKTITNAAPIVCKDGGSIATGTTITNYAGVLIEDMNNGAVTATNADSIRIAAQTADGSVGTDGNINMLGGDWDDGHIQLGAAHIWYDGTNLRAKLSVPTSAGDGTILL
jgi:hypothetical protein